jgi:PilZ domain
MSTQPSGVHPRFAVAITVMLREATGEPVLAQLKNISLSGCYLETPHEIKEDARVRVVLQTGNLQAEVCRRGRRQLRKPNRSRRFSQITLIARTSKTSHGFSRIRLIALARGGGSCRRRFWG